MTEDYPRTLLELELRFSDKVKCRDYLFALRWPQGLPSLRRQRAGDPSRSVALRPLR